MFVNSAAHHQAVKKLGKGLIVNSSSKDGVIEGIEKTDAENFVLEYSGTQSF